MSGIDTGWLKRWEKYVPLARFRDERPGDTEAGDTAVGVDAYVRTIVELDVRRAREEPPERGARRTAIKAATANRMVAGAEEHLGPVDRADPKDMRTAALLEHARGMATGLALRAETELAGAGLDLEAPAEHALQMAGDARRIDLIGHAGALMHQLDQIEALAQGTGADGIDEWISSRTLAIWAHEIALLQAEDAEETDDPLDERARQRRAHALGRLTDSPLADVIESHRPIQISPRAAAWPGGWAVPEDGMRGPDWPVEYDWDEGAQGTILMRYRHQGRTYVKLVDEPYEHPINARIALEHCNELEDVSMLPQEANQFAGQMPDRDLIRQATRCRALALAGLHDVPRSFLGAAVEAICGAVPDQVRQEAMIHLLAQEQDGAAAILQEIAGPPITVRREDGREHDGPVHWPEAESVLTIMVAVTGGARDTVADAAELMGWPAHSAEVGAFIGRLQNDRTERGTNG